LEAEERTKMVTSKKKQMNVHPEVRMLIYLNLNQLSFLNIGLKNRRITEALQIF
jgi:hypothetical protein